MDRAKTAHIDLPEIIHCSHIEEFQSFAASDGVQRAAMDAFETSLITSAGPFEVHGYCVVCETDVGFLVDYQGGPWAGPEGRLTPNWRERLECPHCHLNNRMRAAVGHLIAATTQDDDVYLTEATTSLFRKVRDRLPRTVGSEFLRDGTLPGRTNAAGITHQDATALTFDDNSFDRIGSFDVLEHVPAFDRALAEFFRCLKPGGMLVITVPFRLDLQRTLVRAQVGPSGDIEHLLPPEVHGDPVDPEGGSLCYYHFGWDLLETLRDVGFHRAELQVFWSSRLGYLGSYQFLIVATKPLPERCKLSQAIQAADAPACPVCRSVSIPFREVDRHQFFACNVCGLIHLDAATLRRIDVGETVFRYEDGYWQSEMIAARERAYGIAIARAAEVMICCCRPVLRFLDVGTGPGTFLDAIAEYLPYSADRFHAVELFPPPEPERTKRPNYRIGRVGDYPPDSFDGGMCIEVFEHLTPVMVDGLLGEIAAVATDGACFLVNTGLAQFVREEVPSYLDPIGRGHITIWTVAAVDHLARGHGLRAVAFSGRSWCFLLEKTDSPPQSIAERAAAPLAENLAALYRPGAGASAVAELGKTGLRESHHYSEFLQRTEWVLSLDREVKQLREIVAGKREATTLLQAQVEATAVLQAQVEAIRASRSWRLTAGLRGLKTAWRGGQIER